MEAVLEKETKDVNTELQTRIRNLVERDGYSQNTIARKIDVSSAVVSQYLNNKISSCFLL